MTTWILLAQRGGASLLERADDDGRPRIVRRIEHPEGRLQDVELGSDRPGRALDSHGPGRSTYTSEEAPHDHVAAVFARELAAMLERGRLDARFDRLVLAAEPRFLGKLRASLPAATRKLVVASWPKESDQLHERDIVARVAGFLDSLTQPGEARAP
jgi:protein required for attachment to host cells